MTAPHQTVTEPKGLAGRSFSVDGKELFKSLTKAIFHGVQLKWEDTASDVLDAISAVGLSTDPPALAYVLICKAASAAMFAIVGEARKANFMGVTPYTGMVEDDMKDLLVEHPIVINNAFFDKPTELPIVQAFQALLGRWLTLLGLEPHISATVTARFPSYFLYSLSEEWRKSPDLYEPIRKSLRENPFNQASEREAAWNSYGALLQRRIDESLYDEAFSLRQIYVPLRAYYEDIIYRKNEHEELGNRATVRTVIDIKTELIDWLSLENRDDAVRVISGGPGSGKSSFAKIFAAEIATIQKLRVLFIPLHLIDPSRELVSEVGRFVISEGILTSNPLDLEAGEDRLLIIFDGLDELANQGKAANETARLFALEISKMTNLRNSHRLRLQVIISGREIVVQGNQSEFRKPHQILTLLPYLIERSSLTNYGKLVDKHNILAKDQRSDWWKQYGFLTGKDYKSLPEPLSIKDLEEITSQPLLNYLVALSYTREKLDFTKNVNLNQIYEDLVSAVYERAYERKRMHESIRNIKPEDFVRILEEIGLAAWHGDGRTTTVQEITRHCEESGLDKTLAAFKEGAEAGVIRLLAAFFFRQHDQNAKGDQTFEFTHKSFGEYLAAQRIVREMGKITLAREARGRNPDKGYNEREALNYWAQVTSANAMTTYIANFIGAELRLKDEKFVRRIQNCFTDLFSFVLLNGMPVEKLGLTFKELCFLARNAEEGLLVTMSLCARVTRKISQIKHPDSYAFGELFKRIQGQRKGADSILATNHLDYLNLRDAVLYNDDFYSANFSHTILTDALITYAIFAHATFTNTNMKGVHASMCSFQGADLSDVDLSGADLEGAIFEDASLYKVNFTRAVFADKDALSNVLSNVDAIITKAMYIGEDRVRRRMREEVPDLQEQQSGEANTAE